MADEIVTKEETTEPSPLIQVPSQTVVGEVTQAVAAERKARSQSESSEGEVTSPDIEFKPIVSLPLVEVKTLEEDEETLLNLRAKLYRYETGGDDGPEWKERGVGEVKLLKHRVSGSVRLLMRRDKTLKICGNHYITPVMELKEHSNNQKAFVWSTQSDFSDEEPKQETLCIRFGSVENASKFKTAFEEARELAAVSTGLGARTINDDDDEEEDDESSDDSQNDTNDGEEETNANKVLLEATTGSLIDSLLTKSVQEVMDKVTELQVNDPLVDQKKSSPIKINPESTSESNVNGDKTETAV